MRERQLSARPIHAAGCTRPPTRRLRTPAPPGFWRAACRGSLGCSSRWHAGRRERLGHRVLNRRQRLKVRPHGLEIVVFHLANVLPRHRREDWPSLALVLAVPDRFDEHVLRPTAETGGL